MLVRVHVPLLPIIESACELLIRAHEVLGVHVPRVASVLEESCEGAAVDEKRAFRIVVVRMSERVLRVVTRSDEVNVIVDHVLGCLVQVVTHRQPSCSYFAVDALLPLIVLWEIDKSDRFSPNIPVCGYDCLDNRGSTKILTLSPRDSRGDLSDRNRCLNDYRQRARAQKGVSDSFSGWGWRQEDFTPWGC